MKKKKLTKKFTRIRVKMNGKTKPSSHHIALKTLVLVGLACFLAASFADRQDAGGFICGALAFCFSAIGLERLTARILQKGDVFKGVKSGVVWLVFKFLAPAGMIFFGLSQGFSPPAVVIGLVCSLGVFAAILWFSRSRGF